MTTTISDKKQKKARRGTTRGDMRRAFRLFKRFKGSPKIYIVGMTLLLFEAATSVIEPYPIAWLIDFLGGKKPNLRELGGPEFLGSARWETILILTFAVILIAAINSAADSLTEICMARGGRSLGYSIRTAMYSHLQRLPLAYHDSKRTGDVLTRVTGDVLVVEEFVVKSVSNIIGSLLVLIGSFTFLMFQSVQVALVALIVVPVLAIISRFFSIRIKQASKTQRGREGELASTAQEMLTSIRLVQSYGRGSVDLHRFSDQTAKSMHASVDASNIQAQFSFVIALVEALAISAVVWLGVWLVDSDAITIGTLVLFILLLQNMFKPARKIVSEWYKIGKVYASVDRIDDLLDRRVMVEDRHDAVEAIDLTGQLTFRHVGFTYPAEHADGSAAENRPAVLEDVDFDVAPGEVVALVGPSGAGKSTVAQLIPRLYDPDEGEVLIDGIPIQMMTLASLRSQVSLVLQDTILLAGSVAENIAYGIEDATQDNIETAAKLANAHEFIMELPDGYQTNLGERGATLSGGQKQRHRHRQGLHPARPAADPRRADHGTGHRVRGSRRRRAQHAHARQDHDRHLPRPRPDPALGPDSRRLRRTDRRVVQARQGRGFGRAGPSRGSHRPGQAPPARPGLRRIAQVGRAEADAGHPRHAGEEHPDARRLDPQAAARARQGDGRDVRRRGRRVAAAGRRCECRRRRRGQGVAA